LIDLFKYLWFVYYVMVFVMTRCIHQPTSQPYSSWMTVIAFIGIRGI